MPLAVATTRVADHQFAAHKNQRARPANHLALGFDKLADLDRADEMHVKLDGRLRLSLIGVPAGHAHRAVGECHQHAALHDAAAVVVLRLGHEGIEIAVAGWPHPERTDQADETLVAIGLPAGGRGIEERGLIAGGRMGRRLNV